MENQEPYFRTPLVIATTHQLLKFYQAFDLLMNEVDAFPYVDNPILYKAQNAIKKENTLYLTATSIDELDKKVKKKSFVIVFQEDFMGTH